MRPALTAALTLALVACTDDDPTPTADGSSDVVQSDVSDSGDVTLDASTGDDAGTADAPPTDTAPADAAPTDTAPTDTTPSDAAPADAADVAADAAPDALPSMCAALSATGTDVGQVPPDVTLMDCDGGAHSLRDLCGAESAWVFIYTGWCPPCQEMARQAEAIFQSHVGAGTDAWLVISETQSFGAPDAAYCAGVRERFGLTMPVLYDPEQALAGALDTEVFDAHVVLDREHMITFKSHHPSRAQLDAAIEAARE